MEQEPTQTFRILMIASEILVPLIVFIGVYFIFKPVFGNKKEEDKPKSED